MSTWTDDQHTTYANARLAWFEANQKSWICPCGRVVEYAPEMAGDPCDHTAYCAGCVRDHTYHEPGTPEWKAAYKAGESKTFFFQPTAGRKKATWQVGIAVGPGAQSYAAHVAAGTLR